MSGGPWAHRQPLIPVPALLACHGTPWNCAFVKEDTLPTFVLSSLPCQASLLHPDTTTFMKPFFPSMLLSVTFRSSDLFSFSKPPHGSKQQECTEHPSVLCEEMLHEGNAEMFLPSGTVGFSQQSICSRMPVTFLQWDFSARSAVLPRARAAPRAGSVSN